LRVRSSRLRAVSVATLATLFLFTVIGPETTVAATPPGLGRFMNAIGHVESGGRYTARNATSGAYGKYQIMPSNWPSWARIYLGDSKAKQTPANQEKVARGKFTTLYRSLGSWRRVAYWWLTGSSRSTGWSAYASNYVNKVMTKYKTASSKIPTGGGAVDVTRHRYSERHSRVTYAGTWKSAGHASYAGDRVKYSTDPGATATFAFTGRQVTWYGPVGPTRGKARLSIDGVYVKTVDLHRGGFTAHAAVFSRSWSSSGSHTLTIVVVGGGRHPMVAIDEFVVRK
jgi:Transglycosylase-like domain